jgi:hypothetical protein
MFRASHARETFGFATFLLDKLFFLVEGGDGGFSRGVVVVVVVIVAVEFIQGSTTAFVFVFVFRLIRRVVVEDFN